MSQPDSYVKAGEEDIAGKFNIVICKVKHVENSCNIKIGDSLKTYGFDNSKNHPCLDKSIKI